ncbi:MAG: DNA-directed RNA polymerase subunit omega [Phycisphaerae bacterium]|nr:DNA-directed RNA polymerase subunit omega [Phycisphaerae bacterium]
MIEALKSDEIVDRVGGRFKLCALIQRRLSQIVVEGARPMVEREGRSDLELVIEEILQDKLAVEWDVTDEDLRRSLPPGALRQMTKSA